MGFRWSGVLVVLLVACGGSSGGDDDDGGGGGAPTQEEIAAACVVAGSCGAAGDGINDCFTDLIPILTREELRCLVGAGADCVAARACVGLQIELAPGCTPGRVCDGNKVVVCKDGVRVTTECGTVYAAGPTCLIGTDGKADCGASTCTTESRACDGSIAQVCDTFNGVLEAVDCATRELGCVNGVCTSAGGGGACTSGTALRCDGTALVGCDGGVESRIDCAAKLSGATCVAITSPFPDAYCGTAGGCQPDKGAETCTGTSINFCAAGVPTSLDCTSLGFSTCLFNRCMP